MGRLLLVSNRLPVTLAPSEGNGPMVRPSSGGLVSGLMTAHKEQGGLWIGWLGDTRRGQIYDPHLAAELASLRIVPVPLPRREARAFYEVFSNGYLWPLFHYLIDQLPLDPVGWKDYQRANHRFAQAVAAQYWPGDLIWVHDYQLMLVPHYLRKMLPDARIGFFLHIPFPAFDVFRILPWRRALLRGLLGADVIAFHTPEYLAHFRAALSRLLGIPERLDPLPWGGRQVRATAMSMGIDVSRFAQPIDGGHLARELAEVAAGPHKILLGVDRLDYTKGIPRRLLAIERLLSREPALREQVKLIQIAVPSRERTHAYGPFRRRVNELIGRINGTYGTAASTPIHYLHRSVGEHELIALYRAADVMLVTPLRDGMNLVAKEFVASRSDGDGVLVLSEFAGAAAELEGALSVNPYDIEATARAIKRALEMEETERRKRMRALQVHVEENDVHGWITRFLSFFERGGVPARLGVAH
jgi:trehalose 6-phosphate synthase/phosphatase